MTKTIRLFIMAVFLSLSVILLQGHHASAAGSDSIFLTMPNDVVITGGRTTSLLTATVMGGQSVFMEADGRYYPNNGLYQADVYITVDGQKVSNDSVINWVGSTLPVQHSFDAIAAVTLSPGPHSVAMVASGSGVFTVGANSSISIVTSPATTVSQTVLATDVMNIQYNFAGYNQPNLPSFPILNSVISVPASNTQPVFALASASVAYNGRYGDAWMYLASDGGVMCGFQPSSPSGQCGWTTSWADNDVYNLAELQSPLYVHGYFPVLPGPHNIQLNAAIGPASGGVNYNVDAGANLVLLNGGMFIYGAAPISPYSLDYTLVNCNNNNTCVQGQAPPPGYAAVIDQGTVNIPYWHNGVVFFTAKTRIQGDPSDPGGNAFLYIAIDCPAAAGAAIGAFIQGCGPAGSVGVQQLQSPDGISTRTMVASYLAAGAKALKPGLHTVTVLGSADRPFRSLSMTKDLPLLWFD